jgi:type IV pilus assembly protein PilY1
VTWNNLPAWTKDNAYQTPDLKTIVQEIVDRPGWQSGNRMVIFLYGASGLRRPWSYEGGGPNKAPLLHIEYQ